MCLMCDDPPEVSGASTSAQPAARSAARPRLATRGAGSEASAMQAASAAAYSSASAAAASGSLLGSGCASGLAPTLGGDGGRPDRALSSRRPGSGSRAGGARGAAPEPPPVSERGRSSDAASALQPVGGAPVRPQTL